MSVSESGFYKWLKKPESKRIKEEKKLTQRIKELFEEHKGFAGSPMITRDLRSEEQFSTVGKNRVARIMKENNLKCKSVKKYRTTTDSRHNEPIAENLLNRQFNVSEPNKVWVGDITYFKIHGKWYYLSIFIDLFSRIVVGWDISNSLHRASTVKALKKAVLRRKPKAGLMIHTDRGVQYASEEFRIFLNSHGFIQSMSRKGNCWDNAVAESFFHTIKGQYLNHTVLPNKISAEQGLFKYIEIYYNRRRRHSSNNWISPADYETQWWNLQKAA